jgi:hypothetical protein
MTMMSGNVLSLNLPETLHLDENLLNCAHICELQQQDKQLLALQVKYPDNYVNLQLDDNVNNIICYKKDLTVLSNKRCSRTKKTKSGASFVS